MNYDWNKRRTIIESALEVVDGVVITDDEGKVVYLNKKYANLLQVDPEESIGKHVLEIIPQTRMHVVTQTGQDEIGSVHVIKEGMPVVCNRLPIRQDGKVIGAIAFTTFRKMDEVNSLLDQINSLNRELDQYKSELNKLRGAKYSLEQIVGSTPQMIELKNLVRRIAQSKLAVLISGETGTGKELFSHAIHQLSPRHYNPFVRLNCAAIPKELLESELFGYEEGAFTGARKGGKPGKFELANGGTLLLDEINELPLYLQSKLLRVIQEKEIERLGGLKIIELDFRLICTSNKNILDLVKQGSFREDLYYRINVVELKIPPIRKRVGDIPELIEYLIKKINREYSLQISGVKQEVLNLFCDYQWPGNIRELEHVLERAAIIAMTGEIGIEHIEYLLPRILGSSGNDEEFGNDVMTLEDVKEKYEKEAIIKALVKTKGNKTLAAEMLAIDRSVLYAKLKKYKIL